MKKLKFTAILAIFSVLMIFSSWAAGTEEEEGPKKLILGIESDFSATSLTHLIGAEYEGKGLFVDYVAPLFTQRTGIQVEVQQFPPVKGTPQKIINALAAGDHIDVFSGYGGRVSHFANSEWAYPLSFSDNFLSDFIPGFVDLLRDSRGVLYGLPQTAWGNCWVINVSLLKRIGREEMAEREAWTYDEFIELSKEVKKLGSDYYGTFLFAGDASGDYQTLSLISGFGFELINGGSIAANSPAGVEALTFLKSLVDSGLAIPGPNALTDAQMYPMWMSQKVLAMGYTWGAPVNAAAGDPTAGYEPFEAKIISWPHKSTIPGGKSGVGHNAAWIPKGSYSEEALALLKFITSTEIQELFSWYGRFPSRKSVKSVLVDNIHWKTVKTNIAKYGNMDLGMGLQQYPGLRAAWNAALQGLYSGELSPQQAVAQYESEGLQLLNE